VLSKTKPMRELKARATVGEPFFGRR